MPSSKTIMTIRIKNPSAIMMRKNESCTWRKQNSRCGNSYPNHPHDDAFSNGSPRQLKRFLNTFDLRMRMVQVANIREIDPTVLAKLMLLEYNFKYQRLFESLYGMQLLGDGIIDKIGEVEECARQKKS